MIDWRIEKRHGREFIVGPPHYGDVCGAANDGFRCVLDRGHDGEEHVAAGSWDLRGAEVFKRWPVESAEGKR